MSHGRKIYVNNKLMCDLETQNTRFRDNKTFFNVPNILEVLATLNLINVYKYSRFFMFYLLY